ncbi:hypothetical protein MTR67_030943, partial [Solanum verrucosum]
MKKDVVEFVAQCPNCQQVEHQKPAGLVQEIVILLWKWVAINMDFITGLPRSRRRFDSIRITEELSYEETPIAILDRQVRKLRTKEVASVKVLWRNKNREELTWEGEDGM